MSPAQSFFALCLTPEPQHAGTASVLTPLTVFWWRGRLAGRSAPSRALLSIWKRWLVQALCPHLRPRLGPSLFLTPSPWGPSRLVSKTPEVGRSLPGDPCPVPAHCPEFTALPISPIKGFSFLLTEMRTLKDVI